MSATTVPNPGRALVQGKPHQGPIPRRHGSMARPDARLRVRSLSVEHAADQPSIRRPVDRGHPSFAATLWVRSAPLNGWIAKGKVLTRIWR